ncbi:MAG: peptidoglycan-binding protein [Candidatus Vogelbacteria bacterium]|nr:peptidoglycan-binding protein [Candidatus Vogelbacteria bacterium]
MAKSASLKVFVFAIILWCLFVGSARAGELVISEEFTGSTVDSLALPERLSSERQFVTAPALGTVSPLPAVSEEFSFLTVTTAIIIPADQLAVSEEFSFKTETGSSPSPEIPPGGGGGVGGGGGSSGGSGGGRIITPPASRLQTCPVYLQKYIKFGLANDPIEVRKLQMFLRDFEGFEVPVSGFYDSITFEAVKQFQLRYREAILKPWGIDYPTGYVYITTTLAINNLYCERDPVNDLDFRIRRGEIELPPIATSTATTTPPEVGVRDQNLWQLAALGLLDFIKNHPRLWLLLLILLILLIIFWPGQKRKKKEVD